MKLTKAQRLFVAIGHIDREIVRISNQFFDPYGQRTRPHPHPVWDARRTMLKELRHRRKQLIREALEAARSENTQHYVNGINEVLRQIGR